MGCCASTAGVEEEREANMAKFWSMEANTTAERRRVPAAKATEEPEAVVTAPVVADSASSDESDSEAGEDAVAPAPEPVAPAVVERPRNQGSLAMTAAEEEQQRLKREELQAEVAARRVEAIDIVFDDDDDEVVPDAEVAVEAFSAMELTPEANRGVEHAEAEDESIPTDAWFKERGAKQPAVVWYQTGAAVHVEITPANKEVGFSFEGGHKLYYNHDSTHAAIFDQPAALADSDVVVYGTTQTASREIRDACRGMDRALHLAKVRYHMMDVSENEFMRKQLVAKCGGTDRGLPLLFVGEKFVGDYATVLKLVDDRALASTLECSGYVAPDGAGSSCSEGGDEDPSIYRASLFLYQSLENVTHAVVGGTLVVSGAKAQRAYWPQLLRGRSAEYRTLQWVKKDNAREEDDDDDDDDDE
jgi:hypothetical protein